MGLLELFTKNKNALHGRGEEFEYDFCPRCEANLTLQRGYDNTLSYWKCRGCGEMLYNPELSFSDDVLWFCDNCEELLNTQEGFSTDCGEFSCVKCGCLNRIEPSQIYVSDDEYKEDLHNPYKGLSDEAVLELSAYEEIRHINERDNIILVRNSEDDCFYVKKYLKEYDESIYTYLKNNPVKHMPIVVALFKGINNLVVIEEYISGKSLAAILRKGVLEQDRAIAVVISICKILKELHAHNIIHRDIKPGNVCISDDGEVYLLDINVAKWLKKDETEDTKLLGTLYYAAPEQFGYGFKASTEKTDIYSVGILLNQLITGKLPKEEKAGGVVWEIIEKCICLEPEGRFGTSELIEALERI